MKWLLLLVSVPLFALTIDLYLIGERLQGSVKYCVYSYGTKEVIRTVPAWKKCPVKIKQEI